MNLGITVSILGVVLGLIFWIMRKTRSSKEFKNMSVYESFTSMLFRPRSNDIHYQFFLRNKVDGFYKCWFGTKLLYVASDPDAAQWMLSLKESSMVKATIVQLPSTNVLTDGNIVSVDGEVWRRQRQIYNPAFNNTAYNSYFTSFDSTVNHCLHKLHDMSFRSAGQVEDVNVVPLMSKFTVDLLGKSIFGYDFLSLDGKLDEYYNAYKVLINFGFTRILFTIFPFLDKLSLPYSKQVRRSIDQIKELFSIMIKQHSAPDTYFNDMLSHMLDASKTQEGAYLTEQEFFANLFILFVAGHETTSSALSWLFYELAKHPEIQEKAYQEIKDVLGDKSPSFDDLEKLEYVDKIIKEGLRIHPPVALLPGRRTLQDLKYKDQFIPKDSFLGINIFIIHHHPEHWENPFTFDPERWNKDKKHHRFAHLPFSLGPRMCIGSQFSLIEQKLFIIKFLQKYELLKPKTHQLSGKVGYTLNLNTPDNVWISLKERKN